MVLLILYLIPFAFLLWFVTEFGVNVPYADQWALVPLFQSIISGKATFHDFFVQHNEHRILFSKLIISALALISGWNIQWELYFSVALIATTFLLLFKVSFNQTKQRNCIFHIANISTSFIIFSVIQWENLLWGFQICWFLTNVCLTVAILALSSNFYSTLRLKLAVAALACFIASFSIAHGLLTWIAVIPSLRSCYRDARQFRKASLIWIILFSITCFLYFIDYHRPFHQPDLWLFLKKPDVAATYFLTLFGSPLLYQSYFSGVLGFAVLLNFGFFAVRYIQKTGSKFSNDAAPWISLGCFALLFGLTTTVGRIELGQANTSRYTTVTILLIIALVQLWRLIWQVASTTADPTAEINSADNQQNASISTFFIGIITSLVLITSINSLTAAEGFRSGLKYGQACLDVAEYIVRTPNNYCLRFLNPSSANTVVTRAKDLNQIGFRNFPGKTIEFIAEPTRGYGYLETPAISKSPITVRRNCLNCGMITVSGWAILPEQAKPARLIFLSYAQNPDFFLTNAYVNLSSPDVAKVLGTERYNQARWQAAISPKLLPLGKTVFRAWVYDPDGKQFVRLRGELALSVEE